MNASSIHAVTRDFKRKAIKTWTNCPSLAAAWWRQLPFRCCLPSAIALQTDLPGIDGQSLFSPTFLVELDAANRAGDPLPPLKAVYKKFGSPAERAETELTIACVLCQRTGFVDPAESIKWYDKALVRDLPATALAKQFILRGNMHERLGHDEKALADYIRGVLVCLQFNLPDAWPSQDGRGKSGNRRR